MIEYRITLASGKSFSFRVDPHHSFDPSTDALSHPEWTRLQFQQCSNCPIQAHQLQHCPAAVDLKQIASDFKDIISFERAHVEVVAPERSYVKDCDAQTALRSLLGLVMASSACPILSQFRGLAKTHLPFSSMDETLFRSTAAYLLKQYFVYKSGGNPDLELKGLEYLYKQVNIVNMCFKGRLDAASGKDANLNAIGSLLYVATGVSYSLEENLKELYEMLFGNPGVQ